MRTCIFEDAGVWNLEPLSLSRPVFELRCGITSLALKQLRHVPGGDLGVIIRPHLREIYAETNPHVSINDPHWLAQEPILLINGRYLPNGPIPATGPLLGLIGEEVAWAVLLPENLKNFVPEKIDAHLLEWRRTLPTTAASGRLFRYLWDIVDANGEQIGEDFRLQPPVTESSADRLALIGPAELLRIDPTAKIDPYVVADTTNGPVIIEADAVIQAFTRLEGPCWIGARSQIFGAKIRGGTSIGPNCRIGGEVEASIVQGFSNKYHEGFLGHSYVGEWVNLGAGTHTSDLRNDYGEVRIVVNGENLSTGRMKIGSYIGDHTRTGLGALMNTGTNTGVFGQLLPAAELLPKWIPSFCRISHGELVEDVPPEEMFRTARKVMSRRGEEFTALHEKLFRSIHLQTARLRQQALRESAAKKLRRKVG